MSNVKLGNRIRDKVTGAEGIVVGITDWMYGCRTLTVAQTNLKQDGSPHDKLYLDEPQVEVVGSGLIAEVQPKGARPTGGPERPVSRDRQIG